MDLALRSVVKTSTPRITSIFSIRIRRRRQPTIAKPYLGPQNYFSSIPYTVLAVFITRAVFNEYIQVYYRGCPKTTVLFLLVRVEMPNYL